MSRARERGGGGALQLLGHKRFLAFLRAARVDGAPFAIDLANRELDEHRTLESLLSAEDEYGFHLRVRRMGPDTFTIAFECVAGPMAGDGAEWVVRYDGHYVAELSPSSTWMS